MMADSVALPTAVFTVIAVRFRLGLRSLALELSVYVVESNHRLGFLFVKQLHEKQYRSCQSAAGVFTFPKPIDGAVDVK